MCLTDQMVEGESLEPLFFILICICLLVGNVLLIGMPTPPSVPVSLIDRQKERGIGTIALFFCLPLAGPPLASNNVAFQHATSSGLAQMYVYYIVLFAIFALVGLVATIPAIMFLWERYRRF